MAVRRECNADNSLVTCPPVRDEPDTGIIVRRWEVICSGVRTARTVEPHPLGIEFVRAWQHANDAVHLVLKRGVQLRLIGGAVIEVVAFVGMAAVKLKLHVHVVAVGGRIVTALIQSVAGVRIVVHVDGDDDVVTPLLRGVADGVTDYSGRPKVGVEVGHIVGELILEQINIGVVHIVGNVAGGIPVGVMGVRNAVMDICAHRIVIRRHRGPVREVTVNRDFMDVLRQGRRRDPDEQGNTDCCFQQNT